MTADRMSVRDVYEHNEVAIRQEPSFTQQALPALSQDTFRCQKWENALAHLRANGLADEEHVREILLEGAQTFGMWHVSEPALQSLVAQVLEDSSGAPSAGLQSWVTLSREALARQEVMDLDVSRTLTLRGDPKPSKRASTPAGGRCERLARAVRAGLEDTVTLVKWGLAAVLVAVCAAYASWVVWDKYVGILDLFAWPIFFARAGGLATAIITGLLYLTMARTFMKQAYKLLSVNSKVLTVLDGHKDIHVFLAKCLGLASVVHVLAHLLSTVPALRYGSAKQLNSILACADREHKLKGWPSMTWLQWPACPLTTQFMSWGEILFQSTPGLSGVVLVVLLLVLGKTGRAKARSQNFDRFWYAHNLVLVAWPLTMFVHGSNQWIGVGFPLVAFTSSVPICLYLVDRAARLLRYYLYSGKAVKIAGAVIRPGKGGGPAGALTHLEIQKPPGLWTFVPGMYAFINMPEYAPLQWHPFTICSGKDDEHVEFIISAVGDWTQELAARCLGAQTGQCSLPRVALDGPYAAPAQSALARPILVAVGAGVGITPFLSLMSSLISIIESRSESEAEALPLKEAHFFWMTRSADEFLFGRKHFTRIANSPQLRKKVHLHLHTTAREPEGDAAAYLFRQAVKRQSVVDRAAFAGECDGRQVLTAPQLPWCWVNKSQLDVMWLSDLTNADCVADAAESESRASQDRQASALPRSQSRETPPEVLVLQSIEEGRAGAPGLTAQEASARSSDGPAAGDIQPQLQRSNSPVISIPEESGHVDVASPPRPSAVPRLLALPVARVPSFVSGAASARSGHSGWAQEFLRTSHRRQTRRPTTRSRAACQMEYGECSLSPFQARTIDTGSPCTQVYHSGSPACTRFRSRRSGAPSSPAGVAFEEGSPLQSAREEGPLDDEDFEDEEETMVPVAFGRPDFESELRSIGKHWRSQDKVHVYVCGNDAIVQGLRSTADALNAEALANAQESSASSKKYIVTYERFG